MLGSEGWRLGRGDGEALPVVGWCCDTTRQLTGDFMEIDEIEASHAALHMTIRLARLTHWMLFFMAHLLLWCALLTVLWWTGVRPSDISSAALQWLSTNPGTFWSALGLTGLSVAGAYMKAAKKLASATRHGWLKRYLTKGL